MKRLGLIALLPLTALVLAGCGLTQDAGPQTTQERTISGVQAVDLRTSGDLTILVGDAETLTVTAGSNTLENLTSEVVDGTLVLDSKQTFSNSGPIEYALTVRGLDRIALQGSGDVTGSRALSGDGTLVVSGSGSATLTDLDLTSLTVDLSGSGGIRVSGTSADSAVDVSGSGDYDGSELTTTTARVEASGSGQARVNVTGQLVVSVSGSGDVLYSGNPTDMQRSSSGSGQIVPG